MTDIDPALFYTGLVADLYSPLRSSDPDPEPYAGFIAAAGQPALELGCGDGDPLLELRSRGLDVEGLDSSPDLLEKCRRRAADRGLDVTLHEQRMEELDLPRTYRSMFIAGPTFNLLPDDDTAYRALLGIHRHLEPGGSALIPLFIPQPTPSAAIGHRREGIDEHGSTIRFSIQSELRDELSRTQTSVLRYERITEGETEALERQWILHWHTQDGFRSLAEGAGFKVAAILDPSGRPASPDDAIYAFWLTKP